MGQDT